ncbi:MAG: hypothetical protein WD509_00935 [Candidatus Paceibacterota bacterium]
MNNANQPSKDKQAEKLLREVLSYKPASFYTEKYKHREPVIDSLPTLTWKEIASSPLDDRIYTTEKLFLKIAYRDNTPFLVGRSFTDIVRENYGNKDVVRPFITFPYRHESMEKGFWFYEHNILPLITLEDLRLSTTIAAKYDIDSFISSMESAKRFLPALSKLLPVNALKEIRIIDTSFDLNFLFSYADPSKYTLILGQPDCGALAEACPELLLQKKLVFHVDDNTLLEPMKNTLCTRLFLLPTPLFRYETGIATHRVEATCSCKNADTVMLD